MSAHNMTTIVHPLNLIVSDEKDRAAKLYGPLFASAHEGYGVIAEEIMEASKEAERLQKRLYCLLLGIQLDNNQAIIDAADSIRDVAVNVAAELVQVAAMCEKLVVTIREEMK